MIKFIKNNSRYILVFFIMVAVYWINTTFPADIISSQSCAGGNCPTALENPTLTDEKPAYYINDILNSQAGEYYRLSFQYKSTKNSSIDIKIMTPLDDYQEIKTLELKKTPRAFSKEVLFKSAGPFTDLVFRKNNSDDGSEIEISNVLATKLNISSEEEFSALKPAIRGEVDFNVSDQKQLENSKYFSQLKEPNILGQVFKSDVGYISAVLLDMDIIKQGNNGENKYDLELREADFDGQMAEIGSVLADLSFSPDDLDKFRQEDGKYKFPLFLKLDSNRYYFIGINNDRANTNKFNYIRVKGSEDSSSYNQGGAFLKHNGRTYSVGGNLYFITYGPKFEKIQGQWILAGAVIENIGKNQGRYTYQPEKSVYDLADLEAATKDVYFDNSKGALAGSANSEDNSSYTYKFFTVYPFKRIAITAQQANINWSQVSLNYSFDGKNWKDIPSNDGYADNLQKFQYVISQAPLQKEIYLKVFPKNTFKSDKRYGIKNLKIEADLVIQ